MAPLIRSIVIAGIGSGAELWAFVAAVGALASVAVALGGLELARRWNRRTARRADEISAEIGGIAHDIAQLASLTEVVHRETQERERTRVPAPRVVALVDGGETHDPSLTLRPSLRVDRDALREAALARARATAPKVPSRNPYGISLGFGPTERDVEEYREEVGTFSTKFDLALKARAAYEDELNELVILNLRLFNDGAIPLDDARLVVCLPEGLRQRPGIRKPERLPRIPYYRDRMIAAITPVGGGLLDRISPPDPFLLRTEFRASARAGEVEWHAGDLQHGAHIDASPLILAVGHQGIYDLVWRIHGDNLLEPATGQIALTIDPPNGVGTTLSELAQVGLTERDD